MKDMSMKKNPFERFEQQPKEIQKSEIFNSLKYGNNPVMFKKTGKELKEHIKNVLLPKLLEKKDFIQVQLDDFLNNSVVKPMHPCYTRIDISEEEFPYKQYNWDEVKWTEKSFGDIFGNFGDVGEDESVEEEVKVEKNCPYFAQSKEESESRDKYNRLVEDFRDIIMDIKTANVLITNLNDKDEYWLNLEQLTSLKFEENK